MAAPFASTSSPEQAWGPIGRPLRIGVLGPIDRAQRVVGVLGDGVELFDGHTAGLGALRPDAVDAIIAVESDGEDLTVAAQTLRAQFVGVVLVVEPARADVLSQHLGLVFEPGAAFDEALRNLVSVAAQTTWALAHAAALMPKGLVAPRLAARPTARMTSSTRPYVPSAEVLAALALDEAEDAAPARLTESALFSSAFLELDTAVGSEPLTALDLEDGPIDFSESKTVPVVAMDLDELEEPAPPKKRAPRRRAKKTTSKKRTSKKTTAKKRASKKKAPAQKRTPTEVAAALAVLVSFVVVLVQMI